MTDKLLCFSHLIGGDDNKIEISFKCMGEQILINQEIKIKINDVYNTLKTIQHVLESSDCSCTKIVGGFDN